MPDGDEPSLNHTNGSNGSSPRARQLSQILDMLTHTPTARAELVADIQHQVQSGTYLTEEKLDLAIYRMLKDILR